MAPRACLTGQAASACPSQGYQWANVPGHLLQTVGVATAADCCAACSANSACIGIDLSTPGSCTLFSGSPSACTYDACSQTMAAKVNYCSA